MIQIAQLFPGEYYFKEAIGKCFTKWLFLKILQNRQANTYAGVPALIKFQAGTTSNHRLQRLRKAISFEYSYRKYENDDQIFQQAKF